MKVKDIMTKDVLTVQRSTTLRNLVKIFLDSKFHTLPVVDEQGKLVGIVALADILKVFQRHSTTLTQMLKNIPFLADEEEEDLMLADVSAATAVLFLVDDLMNNKLVTVEEDVSITEVRSTMKLHGIEKLPVVKDGRLVGIISLFDIILAVFKEKGII
ncbi:MAG: CBS domain-containing protein [bacterium]